MDEAWAAGLVMSGIFAWILSFPLFGPLAGAVRSYQGFPWPYVFTFAHGTSLLLLSFPALQRPVSHYAVLISGTLLFVLTASVVLMPLPFWLLFLLFVLMGLAAALLVVSWSPWFAAQSRPHLSLAVLIVGANLLLLVLPTGIAGRPEWMAAATVLLGLLPLVASVFLSRALRERAFPAGFPTGPAPPETHSRATVAALVAFAFAGYVIGGLMYQRIYPDAAAHWPDALVWGTATYCLAAAAAAGAQKWGLPLLSTVTLSTLGLGLSVFSQGQNFPHALPFAFLIVMAGLGGVDMFFWLSLWTLSWKYGARRAFGVGLGGNVLLVAATGELAGSGLLHDPLKNPVLDLLALILVLLAVPFVARNTMTPLRPLTGIPAEGPLPDAESPAPKESAPETPSFRPPYFDQLSRTEQEVFQLLIHGSSDLDIADALYVSRNTAKFHVRNILRKAGFKYRKELLSSIIKDLRSPEDPNLGPGKTDRGQNR